MNRVSRYGMAWHGILANSTEKGYPKVYFHGVKVFKKINMNTYIYGLVAPASENPSILHMLA